jgi:hypothetical protein
MLQLDDKYVISHCRSFVQWLETVVMNSSSQMVGGLNRCFAKRDKKQTIIDLCEI